MGKFVLQKANPWGVSRPKELECWLVGGVGARISLEGMGHGCAVPWFKQTAGCLCLGACVHGTPS